MGIMDWSIGILVGALTGVLSAFGVGGGSLLLIYLTSFANLSQPKAQGINLLYFLPAASTALPSHFKNRFVEKSVLLPAILAGLCTTTLASFLSNAMDMNILRKLFGVFLLVVGLRELFSKDPNKKQKA